MVLMSDGQANEGVYDRGELAQLASDTATHGISISTVGVGLDFDEVTMQRLANVGHGSYYFVEDTANLAAMFSRELGSLSETVASQVGLVLTDGPGARIVEAYGYPMERVGSHAIIPIADLRAGETRKVVLRAQLAPAHTGPLTITELELAWQRIADGERARSRKPTRSTTPTARPPRSRCWSCAPRRSAATRPSTTRLPIGCERSTPARWRSIVRPRPRRRRR
jgi:Ca-activated chloride channel family protein